MNNDIIMLHGAYTFDDQATKRTSYILSTKNRADKLDCALANCRKFVEPEDELIVIDGASEDTTREVLQKYADLIDIVISEPDRKSAHAANKGMLLARGKYIKPLTDDDEFYPDAMKKAIEVLDQHPEIDLLLCGGSVVREGKTGYIYIPAGVNYGTHIEDLFRYPRSGGSQFFRRRALALIGLIPLDSRRPDGEMTYRAFSLGLCVRFARINSFRHYSDIHQIHNGIFKSARGRRKERNTFLFSAAKESCSRSFYWKYRIINTVQGSAMFRMLRKIRRIFYRKIKYLGTQKSAGEKYIWDGGLS